MNQSYELPVQYTNADGEENLLPIILQPTVASQPITHRINNIPCGLECLLNINQIFVRQEVELLEVLLGCETKNKYLIYDSMGRQIFYAKEETDCLARQCCGSKRPFEMTIKDGMGQEVIHLSRPLACGGCCFPCCLQSIQIQSPPGFVVGTVDEEWSFMTPRYTVKDAIGNVVFRIQGHCCTVACCGDVDFHVLSADSDTEVGKISKKWSGLAKEVFTDADNFGIRFPIDLDVKMKAVLIGACMLIDFMYFEKSGNN